MAGRTLYDKLWDSHLVQQRDDGTSLIYIDRQLLHEVTSPQAFEGLRLAGRRPWRLDSNLATPDHNVPTTLKERSVGIGGIEDEVSRIQVQTLDDNCRSFDIEQFSINDERQGIVHVVGPEQGATLPGMTVVCGDSHTATHGAFGALAHGIGTSEVEHVLATQCLIQRKMKNLLTVCPDRDADKSGIRGRRHGDNAHFQIPRQYAGIGLFRIQKAHVKTYGRMLAGKVFQKGGQAMKADMMAGGQYEAALHIALQIG